MRRMLTSMVFVLFGGALSAQDFVGPTLRPVDRETMARIQEWTRVLINELDFLQDDISSDITDPRVKQALTRLRRGSLQEALTFQRQIRGPIDYHRLAHGLEHIEEHLTPLLRSLDELPARLRSLHRTIRRIRLASTEVGYFVSATNPWVDQRKRLARHTKSLEEVAADLASITRLYQGTTIGRNIQAATSHYCEGLEAFQKQLGAKGQPGRMRKQFTALDNDWQSLARQISRYSPRRGSRSVLHARAERVGHLHHELGKLLNVDTREIPIGGFDERAAQQFHQRLQGTWYILLAKANGIRSKGEDPNHLMIFTGNQYILQQGKAQSRGTFRIVDGASNPKQVDFISADGRTVYPGILQIEGDILRYCATGDPAKPRPDAFETRRGDSRSLSIWRRARR